MIKTIYDLKNPHTIDSPALVFYEDIIRANTLEVIRIAGNARRLWPHVKTHKMRELVNLQRELGIERFKCSTIAEAEMLAQCGAPHILLAYPLVGPMIARFLRLQAAYPDSTWWAIGDNPDQLRELGRQASVCGTSVQLLIDVDMGMHRTGVPFDQLEEFYAACVKTPGIVPSGLHCYDGHNTDPDLNKRRSETALSTGTVHRIRESLIQKGFSCDILVMGGTPSFPCHAESGQPFTYLSPGTVFIYDHAYKSKYQDLNLTPAAVLLSRVVSRPSEGLFTIDLGCKGISADPAGERGIIANLPESEPVMQSEEHWVFRMREGHEKDLPSVGDILYVIPTHVCPTNSLYPSVLVARNGEITGTWEVTARNRRLSI